MSLEEWKSIFEISGVILLFLTFLSGAGVLFTSTRINARQAEQLRQFEKGLTDAKTELGKQQERAAKAEGDAAEAKSTAANANDRTLSLETDAAAAKERAAKAEKELLELQQNLADRSLSDEQLKSIAVELKPFSGQEYEVVAYWDSKESVAIAERINQALQLGGWKYLPLKEWHGLFGGVVGVQIWSHPDADERTKEAVKSLVTALVQAGLQSEPKLQNPTNNPKHNKISLSVGSKR